MHCAQRQQQQQQQLLCLVPSRPVPAPQHAHLAQRACTIVAAAIVTRLTRVPPQLPAPCLHTHAVAHAVAQL